MTDRPLRIVAGIIVVSTGYALLVIFLSRLSRYPDNCYWAAVITSLASLLTALSMLASSQRRRVSVLRKIDEYDEVTSPVLYSSGQEELRFTKGLQWNLSYYILAAFGVLYVLSSAAGRLNIPARDAASVAIFLLDCATFNYGIYMICELQFKLREHRVQLDRSKFYKDGYLEDGLVDERRYSREKEADLHFWRDPRIIIMLIAATTIGFLVVAFMTWAEFRDIIYEMIRVISG